MTDSSDIVNKLCLKMKNRIQKREENIADAIYNPLLNNENDNFYFTSGYDI